MDLNKLSVNKLRTELWTCHILSEQRCLRKACEWAEDLLFALPEEGEEKLISKLEKDLNDISADLNPQYEHAKACFELCEYDRAAHLIRNQLDDDKCRFLHYFSMYKAAEKKRIDLLKDVSIHLPKAAVLKFNELRDSLERSMDKREPDGWLLYIYGLVLNKFKLHKNAIEVLEKAINLTPINWSAWYVLTTIVDCKKQLHELDLPNHLFKVFFYHMMRLELDILDNEPLLTLSFKETKFFIEKYFRSSLFIKTLAAKSLGFQSCIDEAIEIFRQIRQEDPYRVDAMEVYSDTLFIGKMRKDLAKLAYEIERVDPFTSEANSCIANSFTARDQNTKAIVYFTRALRLNPDNLNSWALIGHEYSAMESFDKASQAYRFAISINKRDCRAWLGLGNIVEKSQKSTNEKDNHEPCLYYYSQVGKYRPKDHTMFLRMGGAYERMGKFEEAITCFRRAGPDGPPRLAQLCEKIDAQKT